MSRNDKLILWGAAAIMVAVGSLSLWKESQVPTIDPEIASLAAEHKKLMTGARRHPGPGPVPGIHLGFVDVIPEPRLPQTQADLFRTRAIGTGVPPVPIDVFVLSLPLPAGVKSTLDETTLTWSLVEPKVELKSWWRRKDVKPTGFIIKRQCENETPVEIAKVGPKETSFVDLTTQPRLTYRYWVEATGRESNLALNPPHLEVVTKGIDVSVKTRTPANTRAKLVGGDKGNAFLRVETYDRTSKKWLGKTEMAVPGQKVGKSGWTLNGLRFDNFTLVADVTDDEGVDRVLTTKD